MKKYATFILIAFFAIAGLKAQLTLAPTVLASAGGYSESGNISLSWTLGELAVTSLSGGDLILTQGFQQPYSLGTGISGPTTMLLDIIAFPNPVERELYLKFNIEDPGDFVIEITDVSGRIMSIKQYRNLMPGEQLPVEMQSYPQGLYLFKVCSPDRTMLRVFRISKI